MLGQNEIMSRAVMGMLMEKSLGEFNLYMEKGF